MNHKASQPLSLGRSCSAGSMPSFSSITASLPFTMPRVPSVSLPRGSSGLDDPSRPLLGGGGNGGSGGSAAGGIGSFSFDFARGGDAKKEQMPSLLAWGGADGDGLGYHRRLRYFALLLVGGLSNFALAGLCLPIVLLRPAKFSLFFTLGNFLMLASFAVLRGVREQLQHMFCWSRMPFTAAYLASVLLTLYCALFAHSYSGVLLFSAAQCGALAYYLASYLPGGSRAIRFITAAAYRAISQACGLLSALCCRRQNSLLPL